MQKAMARGWDPLDVDLTGQEFLSAIRPQFAIVNGLPDDPLCVKLRDLGCKIVRLGRLSHPMDDLMPAVLPDYIAQGRLAAEHFAERGFRHVGYVGSNPFGDMKDLYEGMRSRAEELGLECHLLQFTTSTERDPTPGRERFASRMAALKLWVAKVPGPLGVFTYSDRKAFTLCTMCRHAGLVVPENIAILGSGNDEATCECAPVALSSIDMNHDGMVDMTFQLLDQMQEGIQVSPNPVYIPPRGVILRESTDVLASTDKAVARALRFIWDNYEKNISVDRIANAAKLPRWQLERVFKKELARGINAELRRKRLEVFVRLLTTTDIPVIDLCAKAGFFSKDYLHRAFKRAYGTTPAKYRKQFSDGKNQ